MTTSRTERIPAHDGGDFQGHLAVPQSGSSPGMVVIQEIFGVNDYVKDACRRLAELGYVALAPDLYWRIEPGIAIDEREPDALQRAFGYMGRLDFSKAADDAVAALERLRELPEVGGGAGILGFCLGGGVAYMVAAAADPDACVSYYGSAVPDALGLAGDVTCPILFQFGDADQYLPVEKQQAVMRAFERRPGAEFPRARGRRPRVRQPQRGDVSPRTCRPRSLGADRGLPQAHHACLIPVSGGPSSLTTTP